MEALKARLRLEAVIVVGSRARNDHWRDSDIDAVVVSPDFRGMRRGARIECLLQPWLDTPALEPLGYTPEEVLNDPDSLYLWEALADGRPLLDAGIWSQAVKRLGERIGRGELLRRGQGRWHVTH